MLQLQYSRTKGIKLFDGADEISFDNVFDEKNYTEYSSVMLGGFGDRGSDISLKSNNISIYKREENKIILKNSFWHLNPECKSPELVCHIDNGKIIVDGKFTKIKEDKGEPEFEKNEQSGKFLSYEEKKLFNYYLRKDYNYTLIFEDGCWKFNNFIYWD